MSCTDESILIEFADRMKGRGDLPSKTLARHIATGLASHKQPLPMFRDILDAPFAPGQSLSYHSLSKLPEAAALAATNCHNGQKKLTLSLLEFITGCLTRVDAEDALVVYPGASGLATVVAAKLFPKLRFAAFDPAANTVQLMPPFESKAVYIKMPERPDNSKQLLVFTGEAGFFSDSTCTYVREVLLPAFGRRHILFVSDVRADAEESAIAKDMANQARWAVMLNAGNFMFKFRLPYRDVQQACAAMGRELLGLVPMKGKTGRGPQLPYLAGKLHVQTYGRPTTAELRLVGSGALSGCFYSVSRIEDLMSVFNAVYRSHARFKAVNGRVLPYEAAVEAMVIKKVARLAGSTVPQVRRLVDGAIERFIHGKGADGECSLNAAIKEAKRRPDDPLVKRVTESCMSKKPLKNGVSSPSVKERLP